MKCPICGGTESVHDTRDVPHIYKGEETSIPSVEGDFCPTCGEIILDRENSMRVSAFAGEFTKRVTGPTKSPDWLAESKL